MRARMLERVLPASATRAKRPGHSCIRRLSALEAGDFRELPRPRAASPAQSLEISLLIPAYEPSEELKDALREAHDFLSERFRDEFEIILIPNPPPGAGHDASILACAALANEFPRAHVVPHLAPPGKGAALRTGFLASAGKTVFFTDADLPYDLSFIDAALDEIERGCDLVTANRRAPKGLAGRPPAGNAGRRRLGWLFNHAVRLLLPIGTTDTQAGLKAMSRRLATVAFSQGRCPGFFFDLEIFLSCSGKGWARAEVLVEQRGSQGESTVCVLRESVLAVYWLFRIRRVYAGGGYGLRERGR